MKNKKKEGKKEKKLLSDNIVENTNDISIAKKNWHDRIKRHAVQLYNQNAGLTPMIFFLIKEGNGYKEKLAVPPLNESDYGLEAIPDILLDVCLAHSVVSSCTAFEARFLEKNIENDLGVSIDPHSDRKETLFMIFESLEERITTTFELKDGEVISSEEKVEKINPNHESYVRLSSLLCSGEDKQKVHGSK